MIMATGCCSKPYVTDERLDKGLVLVLTGIEGRSPLNKGLRKGLIDGGVEGAVEIVDWTLGWPLMGPYNLRAETRNRRKAAEIAARIEAYHASHPGKGVTLVGHSGGGAMVAFIAEALGEDVKVDGIIMLAAALSPSYPLNNALAHSRRGIVNYYSAYDWFFLGVGTFIVGTSDGRHSQAAGRVGFDTPQDGATPEGLYQVAWHGEMRKTWHVGGHLTSSLAPYVARYVAPLVQRETWDEEFVRELTKPEDG